jgi:AbrB family looped-hinge helix DNA binding protein
MKPSYKIDPRNRIFIPKEIREILGVKAGNWVEFVNEKGITYLFPASPKKNLLTGKLNYG